MIGEKGEAIGRADRCDDARFVQEVHQPADGHDEEPEGGDRAEERSDARRAEPLDGKEADQDGETDRQHVRLQSRRYQLEPSTAERTEMAGVMIASP